MQLTLRAFDADRSCLVTSFLTLGVMLSLREREEMCQTVPPVSAFSRMRPNGETGRRLHLTGACP
jgi:hypothetical protein